MPTGLLSHGHLVLAALQEGDVQLTDLHGQPLPYSFSELLAPSVPRPVLAHIRDVVSGQRIAAELYDTKDLAAPEYAPYLVAAAKQASPQSAYWRGC